jgi:hypothetical protein
MHERYFVSQKPDLSTCRDHRDEATRVRSEIADHIFPRRRLARVIVLNVVVGIDAPHLRGIGCDQRPVAILKELQDLLLVVAQPPPSIVETLLATSLPPSPQTLPAGAVSSAVPTELILYKIIPTSGGPRIMTRHALAVLLFAALTSPIYAQAQTPAASDKPFVIEYYYKAKWGHADEFLKLFKKNHYPLLKKEVEMGRMLKVWMDQPRYHTTEDGRWDYRVTIVFKNATVASEPFDEDALKKQLYPDQDTYTREEQRRFEILDAHWDLPIRTVDLETKP